MEWTLSYERSGRYRSSKSQKLNSLCYTRKEHLLDLTFLHLSTNGFWVDVCDLPALWTPLSDIGLLHVLRESSSNQVPFSSDLLWMISFFRSGEESISRRSVRHYVACTLEFQIAKYAVQSVSLWLSLSQRVCVVLLDRLKTRRVIQWHRDFILWGGINDW